MNETRVEPKRYFRVYNEKFYYYGIIEQAKLIYDQ